MKMENVAGRCEKLKDGLDGAFPLFYLALIVFGQIYPDILILILIYSTPPLPNHVPSTTFPHPTHTAYIPAPSHYRRSCGCGCCFRNFEGGISERGFGVGGLGLETGFEGAGS